jgi:ubiquinone biosynthesis protein
LLRKAKPEAAESHAPQRGLSRAIEIGLVATRYGFASTLHGSGLGDWVPGRLRRGREVGLPGPVALRRMLEELGPTAVKLGQAAATRSDVLPPDWVEQLRVLQDHVTPVPFEKAREVVEADLGQPVGECFAAFEDEPIASASIAQVYAATLPTGERVAVKVQRPGVHRQVEADLPLLMRLARGVESNVHRLAIYRIGELVADFARDLRGELDFGREARNTKLLGSLLADDPRASVPKVYDALSTSRVLTLEFIDGWKPSDTAGLESVGVDRTTLARSLAGIVLKQILRDGCFHADPHGGNVLIGRDGRLYFLDCGNVAFVPPHLRDDLVYLLFALIDGNAEDVADQILAIGLSTDKTDHVALRADINRHTIGFHSVSTADVSIGDVLEELLRLLFHHRVVMPPIFAQIVRALVLTEAECRALDPRFDFREVARTVVRDTMVQFARPRRAAMELLRLGRSAHHHALQLPRQLLALMRKADAGGLKVKLEYDDLDRPMHRLDTMFNRLAASIIVAAIILAPALWLQVNVGAEQPLWHPAYILLVVGFTLGLWLLASIFRSGRL